MKYKRFAASTGQPGRRHSEAAFTLTEVVVAVAICVMVFSGILLGYSVSSREAEWSGYSAAAMGLSIQQLEQARTAVYDPAQSPVVNQIYSIPLNGVSSNAATGVVTGYTWTNLDVPISGTNYTRATNFVTIKPLYITATSNIMVMMVQVDTVWRTPIANSWKFFTNTVVDYFGPDNPAMLAENANP